MRARLLIAMAITALGVSAVLAAAAVRYYPAYRSALDARRDLQAAQALLREEKLDASATDLALIEGRLAEAEASFLRANRTFRDPIIRAGSRLPLVGGSLEATGDLTEAGLEGARLGRDIVVMIRAFQEQRDRMDGPLTEQAMELLHELDAPMTAMKERLTRMRTRQDGETTLLLLPAIRTAFDELDEGLAEVEQLVLTYEDLAAFLPDLLGFEGTRTYLVLAQNNGELLPTGGLISVYGVITVRDGRIQDKRFGDALTLGGKWLERTGAYIEPPRPLQRYLLKDVSWNLAVSNWSPHFPTAAQEANRFFRLAGGEPVDGVLGLNIHTIEALLEVTGPVTIPSYGVTVTPENAFDAIEEHTRSAPEPDGDRKAFVGLLADEIFTRLMHLPSAQWTPLIETLAGLRDRRQIAFFSDDEELQALGRRLELDGSIEQTTGDYLMLVDANVQSTKLNIVLDQSIDLSIDVDSYGVALHQLRVSYSNNLSAWSASRDEDLVRRLMLDGLYGGYVRLLAPAASQLESVRLGGREVGPQEIAQEEDKSVFGRYIALPQDERTELAFTYRTFGAVQSRDDALVYRLLLQKQPGTGAIPVQIQLTLPDGARLRSMELDGAPIDSLSVVETDLEQDRELVVRYQLAS